MGNLEFVKMINAPREKVWKALWEDANYREWTAAFAEGSCAVTDWKQGSKILFLDAKGEGMVSEVAEARPNEFMSIRHLGTVKNGVEDTSSPESQEWSGGYENYLLQTEDGQTKLTVTMTSAIPEDFVAYFQNTWPKALDKLKQVAERN
ncbi:MAG: SRPBCC domain-containing protein [Chitinophagaceae bacterium]